MSPVQAWVKPCESGRAAEGCCGLLLHQNGCVVDGCRVATGGDAVDAAEALDDTKRGGRGGGLLRVALIDRDEDADEIFGDGADAAEIDHEEGIKTRRERLFCLGEVGARGERIALSTGEGGLHGFG